MITEIIYSMLVYVMFSMTEWVVHKYIMHGDKDKTSFARDHIVHHIHTLPDMKLTNNNTTNFLSTQSNYNFHYSKFCKLGIFRIFFQF
jgi:hypothetical protein